MKKVMIIPGDGVGPEVVSATHKAITALTDEIEFIRFDAGLKYYKEQGYSMSRSLLDAAKDCDAILMGTMAYSDEKRYTNPEDELIRFLGLTTRIHRIKDVVPGLAVQPMDTFIVTPNEVINPITEMEDVDGITRHVRMQYHNSQIVFDTAAMVAEKHGKKSITCINYSDFYKMTCARYRNSFHNALGKKGYDLDDMCIEQFPPTLIRDGRSYEVIAAPLVYSHLISEMLSSYIGGLNLTAIQDYDQDCAVFKPAHGPMQEIAGMDKVNPIGSLMSGAFMLRHFGMKEEAEKLEAAINSACRRGYMTEDLGGKNTRSEFTNQVVNFCRE